MGVGGMTTERKTVAELRAAKAEREAAEKEKAASDRAAIDAAHEALGTAPGTVPGVDGVQDGHEGSDIHDGDDETLPDTPRAMSLGFNVGGKKPTSQSVRLTGGKIDVPGSYVKGSTAVFRVEVVFYDVGFRDETDKATGQIVGCERRQFCRITGISELDA